jgi:hypothetical protein
MIVAHYGLSSFNPLAAAAEGGGVGPSSNNLRLAQAQGVGRPGTVDRPDLKIGDSWNYEEHDGYNHALKAQWVGDIISIDDSRVDMLVLAGTSFLALPSAAWKTLASGSCRDGLLRQ